MNNKKLERPIKPEAFTNFVAQLVQAHDHGHDHGGGGSIETLREDNYEGYHIAIRTTYEIMVDGKVLPLPIGVDNDGNLHCHSLPNYQFASAIEMVKRLIDNFPEDFRKKKGPAKVSKGRISGKLSRKQNNHPPHKTTKKGGKIK